MRVTIRCPYCSEEIPSSSSMCPYCGEPLDQRTKTLCVGDTQAASSSEDGVRYLSKGDYEPNINIRGTGRSDSGNVASSPAGSGERPKDNVGVIIAISLIALLVLGLAVLAILPSGTDSPARSVSQPSQSSYASERKANEPSATPVSSSATFYCVNTKEEVAFDYGYHPYTYGDYVILSGDNGALGRYSGYNVVSYTKSSGT